MTLVSLLFLYRVEETYMFFHYIYIEQIRSIVSKKVGSFEQVYTKFHSHFMEVCDLLSHFLKD